MRTITLTDGLGMEGVVYVFKTNAPKNTLKDLETKCKEILSTDGDYEDIPIWKDELENMGYIFDYVDEHGNVTPFGTSTSWLENKYPKINEHYTIDYNNK